MSQYTLFDCDTAESEHVPLQVSTPITLEEARRELLDCVDSGAVCPCCDRFIRRYKRRFNSGMARSLIWLVRNFDKFQVDGFVDVPNCAPRVVVCSREFDKIAMFGCAQRKPNVETRQRESGMWRPTNVGIDFVYKRCLRPKYMHVLNGEVQGFSDEMVDIVEALAEKFDYHLLMSET